VKELLAHVLPAIPAPCVIDADALNFIAEEGAALPKTAVLTPHRGEMLRLLHMKKLEKIDFAFLQKCQEYAENNKITLVLKGGPSFIFHQGLPIYVSPVGDPGMATAGTGDVLTGLIAALLAQGLEPYQAACLGVYIHGLAGEQAALELTAYCMVASDLFDFFPTAFIFSER
jgi:NAD(P)H-hydrate epimerase